MFFLINFFYLLVFERILLFLPQNNDLNPIWNEHFEFIVEDASTQHLVVRIYDDEGLQSSQLIGCAQVRLNALEPGKVKDVWLNLVKDLEIQRDTKDRGQVRRSIPFLGIILLKKLCDQYLLQKNLYI